LQAGVLVTQGGPAPSRRRRSIWKDAKVVAQILAVVAAVIGLMSVVVPLFGSDDGSDTKGTVAVAPTATSPDSSLPTAPSTPSASTGRPEGGASGDAAVQYLSELEAVQGSSNTHVSKLFDGRETREFNSSILAGINSFSPTYTYVYVVDNGWKFFRATIGIDVSSKPGAEVHFRVYLNDVAIDSGHVLTMQETKDLVIPVSGKSQIKLVTDVQKSGGVGNSGRSTWGDARFTME
jgi:hypothetical protein